MSFRWVILGAGDIAVKFNDAVRRVDGCEVIGVGSRSAERGAAFAQKHGIPASGSYEEMLALRPDAAYIAATTEAHANLTRLCIEYGIPVLCEKAMFTNSAEAEEVFALAKAKGVFSMEAMWSRFLPSIVEMKRQLESGVIGDVKFAEIAIGWAAKDGPGSRFYEPSLGGGAAYDLLVYCYELMEFFLGVPDAVESVHVNWASTGVDETETVILRYPFGHASLCASIGVQLTERTVIHGTKGMLTMPKPHYSDEFTLRMRDGTEHHWRDTQTENGFVYEVQEVVRCVQAGLLESPTVPHELTIRCAKVFDRINAQKGASMTNRVKRALLAMQRYNWEQGVAAQAFLESGDVEIAIAMAHEGAYRQNDDGRCSHVGDSTAVNDPCAIGEALIFACEQTGDPFLCAARDKLLHWALHDAPRSPEGLVYHFLQGQLIWVDSIYMLPPFLARAGEYDEALRQLDGYWRILYTPENGLLAHQWSDAEGNYPRRDAWAVGNGWAMSGMARVIAMLPENHEGRDRLIDRVRSLINAALPYQMEDGAFHDVLDDPTTFREVNFAQMLAYTIYRGVKAGWLDASLLPYAEKARTAALAEVDAYGLVRNVCGAPHFDKAGVAPEGQSFHILMEAARADLYRV